MSTSLLLITRFIYYSEFHRAISLAIDYRREWLIVGNTSGRQRGQ